MIVLGELAVSILRSGDTKAELPAPGAAVAGEVLWIEETEYEWQVLLSCRPGIRILASFGEYPPVTIGADIQVKGIWQAFSPATNPGQFDAASYYHARNIWYRLKVKEYQVLKTPKLSYRQWLSDIREALKERLIRLSVGEDGSVLAALLLGDKNSLDPGVKTLYQKAGIAHILAISGLHVSLIGMTLFTVLRKLSVPYSISAALSGFLVVSFCILSGSSISTLRAGTMYVLFLIANVSGRSYDLASAMAVAAVLILLRMPGQLYQAGFLLSFGTVSALALVCPCYLREEGGWQNKVWVVVVLQLQLLPLTLYFYYQYPLYSMLLNLVVVPLLTPLFFCGVAGMALGRIFFWPVHGVLGLYEWLCGWSLALPGALLSVGRPSLGRIVGYYAGFFAAARMKQMKKTRTALCLLALCPMILLCRLPSKELKVTVLDVGQGDGILIELPGGGDILLDGGSSSVRQVGTYRLLPCLKSKGIYRLLAAAITHPDSDHCNGVLEVMASGEVRIDRLLLPGAEGLSKEWAEVLSVAEEQNIPVEWIGRGDKLIYKEASLLCLSPKAGDYSGRSNEASLVFWLQYREFDMLFTGDVEKGAEEELMAAMEEYGLKERTLEVLKVAHHGSDSSTSEELLDAAAPACAVLSYGAGNSYGHPHQEVMKRLTAAGCEIYETAKTGAVEITTEGKNLVISGYLEK